MRGERRGAKGEGRGGLLLGRFYFSKWLKFPVLGLKKVLVSLKFTAFNCFKITTILALSDRSHSESPEAESGPETEH